MRFPFQLRPAAICAVAASMVVAVAGCGRDDTEGEAGGAAASPGITDTEIKIGGSYPLSGPASAYATIAQGARARFEAQNAEGGVNGRKITFTAMDDGYEPARALTNARRLVEQDEVFAVFGSVGTATNLAAWDYLNQQKVPNLFLGTGGSQFGEDPDARPYSIGWQPDYAAEARVYAEYLKRERPDARVAILYQNDDFGTTLLDSFTESVDGTQIEIVQQESYEATDPTISSQMRNLSNSDADTFVNFSSPKFAAQSIAAISQSSWKPLHILSNVSASKELVFKPVGLENAKGIISENYYKDPIDARWADDPAMQQYKAAIERYEPRANPNEQFTALGWSAASTLIAALEQMQEPTRESLMEAVKNMDTTLPSLLPDVKVETSPTDYYPIQSMYITEFDGDQWQLQGDVIHAEAGKAQE
jgi:branched-chain amino acid transport system substrate-binding protein